MLDFLVNRLKKLTTKEPKTEPVPSSATASSHPKDTQPQLAALPRRHNTYINLPRPSMSAPLLPENCDVPQAPWDFKLLSPIKQTFSSYDLYWVYKSTYDKEDKLRFETYFKKYPEYYEKMKAIDEAQQAQQKSKKRRYVPAH